MRQIFGRRVARQLARCWAACRIQSAGDRRRLLARKMTQRMLEYQAALRKDRNRNKEQQACNRDIEYVNKDPELRTEASQTKEDSKLYEVKLKWMEGRRNKQRGEDPGVYQPNRETNPRCCSHSHPKSYVYSLSSGA